MELLTDKDVMAILSIKDKRTLRKYRKLKGLDFLMIGKSYRYNQDMVKDFIHKNSSLSVKIKNR